MIDPLTLSFFLFLPFPRDLGVAAVGWHGPARRRGSDGKAPRGGEGCGGEGSAARDDAGIFLYMLLQFFFTQTFFLLVLAEKISSKTFTTFS